jgi:hypothetical protein
MEYIGFGLFAGVLLAGSFLLVVLPRRTRRNEGSTHGGGWDGRSAGIWW